MADGDLDTAEHPGLGVGQHARAEGVPGNPPARVRQEVISSRPGPHEGVLTLPRVIFVHSLSESI